MGQCAGDRVPIRFELSVVGCSHAGHRNFHHIALEGDGAEVELPARLEIVEHALMTVPILRDLEGHTDFAVLISGHYGSLPSTFKSLG